MIRLYVRKITGALPESVLLDFNYGLAPFRVPQTASREDNGEGSRYAETKERPDEKEPVA